jgi:hypothetical protein
MPNNASLSISSLVQVTASLAAAATQAQSTKSMLVLVDDPTIDVTTRIQNFTSALAVAQQCGGNSVAAAAAATWFDQVPQPQSLSLGRWVQTASHGQLIGAPLTPAQQLIATWQAITDGGFSITIDGGVAQHLTGLNFSGAANLNGVAGVIQAVLTGATIVFNPIEGNFVVTSDTTGATSTVTFAAAPTGGGVTDISAMLGLTNAAGSGAFLSPGIAAESALSAVTLFDTNFGQQFYGLAVAGAADADHTAIAVFIAASSNKHFYWVSTQETGVLVANDTTDIAFLLKQANVGQVAVEYNGSSIYSAISLAGLMMTVDYAGSNTVRNAMYGQEPGITGDSINATQLAALLAKNANGFVQYNNGTSIVQPGICSNGTFIDTVIGKDALTIDIQADVFNLFLTTHVPQDDAGNHMIKAVIEKRLSQYAANGYIAPGTWNGPLFGSLQNNADGTPPTLSTGYYVFQPPIASQPANQRAQRISVPFQIAVNLAGAVQTVNVLITLA